MFYPSFAEKLEEAVPAELHDALLPLVRMAAALSDCIQGYDEKIEKLGREKYGHTALLRQVKGVGPITALAYVLTLENPGRFVKSRDVGPSPTSAAIVPRNPPISPRQDRFPAMTFPSSSLRMPWK